MTRTAATYRASVAGGLRVATGPLALVAANVNVLVTQGYQVWVRDPDNAIVAVSGDGGQLHLSFHPGPGTSPTPPPWVGRFSDLLAEISNTNDNTNPERSNTP